ncbi:MAG TPA: tripartite tricarboxylate transporter substrate-binding protein [Acetobacteraceae bacterium]|nr:tripartite tricarboxylate transporter substrate-binding protein [Acetobacteraceae bacterium]
MRRLSRRSILAGGALLAVPGLARAQGFDRSLRLVVPFPPGGTSDILARLIAGPLGRNLGQTIVVENRPGAGGNIGTDAVAKSAPDGHTLLLLDTSALATNPSLYTRLPFDVERDLAPVQMVVYAPYIVAVSNALPVRNAGELAAWARANPGRLNVANSGTGTLTHIVSLMLAAHWQAEVTAVPYRGGAPALLAVTQNESQMTLQGATQSMPYVAGGQMRGIAVSGPRRLPALPDLPTFRELGWPQPDAGTWQGLLVQGGTPRATVARLEEEVRRVLEDPAIRTRIAELGGEVVADGAEAFRARLRADTVALGEVIRANNLRIE